MINRNMRCIEITPIKRDEKLAEINRNMRCIEIGHFPVRITTV